MIIDENRPEPNEGKVTYTYDHLDRLLYRNVYQGDVPHLRAVPTGVGQYNSGNPASTGKLIGQRKPKKLLYQDYYTYNNNGLRSVKRIYQPIVEAPTFNFDDGINTIKTNILCKSPVIVSGFMYIQTGDENEAKAKLMYKSMYTSIILVGGFNNNGDLGDNVSSVRFIGKNATGTITHTLPNSVYYLKAFAQIETGTLFSKTIYIPEV
jgi:hypothetical protein